MREVIYVNSESPNFHITSESVKNPLPKIGESVRTNGVVYKVIDIVHELDEHVIFIHLKTPLR